MHIKFIQKLIDNIRLKRVRKKYYNQYQNIINTIYWINQSIPIDSKIINKLLFHQSFPLSFITYKNDVKIVKNILKEIDPIKVNYTPKILREHQLKIVKLLKKIITNLESQGFHPMLTGGTLLGAVRHKGFIPWDDDVDIDLMRNEWNNFINYIKKNYIFVDGSSCNSFSEHRLLIDYQMKKTPEQFIFSEKPTCISCYFGSSLDNCITIDFFPRDFINPHLNEEDYIKYRENKISLIKKTSNWGRYFEIAKQELKNQNIFVEKSSLTANGWGNYGFLKSYNLSVMNYDDVFPCTRLTFEGHDFYAIRNYDKYLSKCYGENYMKIPMVINIAGYIDDYNKWLRKRNRQYYINLEEITEKLKQEYKRN